MIYRYALTTIVVMALLAIVLTYVLDSEGFDCVHCDRPLTTSEDMPIECPHCGDRT